MKRLAVFFSLIFGIASGCRTAAPGTKLLQEKVPSGSRELLSQGSDECLSLGLSSGPDRADPSKMSVRMLSARTLRLGAKNRPLLIPEILAQTSDPRAFVFYQATHKESGQVYDGFIFNNRVVEPSFPAGAYRIKACPGMWSEDVIASIRLKKRRSYLYPKRSFYCSHSYSRDYLYEGSPGQEGMMKRFRGLYAEERQLRSKLHALKDELRRFLASGQGRPELRRRPGAACLGQRGQRADHEHQRGQRETQAGAKGGSMPRCWGHGAHELLQFPGRVGPRLVTSL